MLLPQNGCVALLKRLQPIRDENPGISWENLVCHFILSDIFLFLVILNMSSIWVFFNEYEVFYSIHRCFM